MSNPNYVSFNKSRQNISHEFREALDGFIDEHNEDQIIADLLGLLPDSTFDAVQPFDIGKLFFASNIFDESVAALIDDLYRVHLNLQPGLPIELTINSGGGDVYAGEGLIGAIQDIQLSGRDVNITVHGIAASMASIILQVGSKRRITFNSSIMLHEVSSTYRGKLSSVTEDHEANRLLQDRLFGYYTVRTTKPISYYHSKLKKKDLYLSSEESLAEGLVDEIVQPPKYNTTPPKRATTTAALKRAKNV